RGWPAARAPGAGRRGLRLRAVGDRRLRDRGVAQAARGRGPEAEEEAPVRRNSMRRLAPLLFAVIALGCQTASGLHAAPAPAKNLGESPIDLLARGFLARGDSPAPGFGYYAYLVFLDAGETTRPQREAAIRAFAHLLEDVRDVESLNVPRE